MDNTHGVPGVVPSHLLDLTTEDIIKASFKSLAVARTQTGSFQSFQTFHRCAFFA